MGDDDSVCAGVGERALADHGAERLHSGGMVGGAGVQVDEEVVCLGGAARGGRKGSEGDEGGRMVPRGGEQAEARERGRGQGKVGEEGAEVGEGGEGGEAGGEGVEERERRGRGEGAEEVDRRRRRGRAADSVERDHGVGGWDQRRRGRRGAEAEAQGVDEAGAAEVEGDTAGGRGWRGHRVACAQPVGFAERAGRRYGGGGAGCLSSSAQRLGIREEKGLSLQNSESSMVRP